MRLLSVVFAATVLSVQAFKDTSPFLLFSTTPSSTSIRQVPDYQIKSRAQVLDTAQAFLSGCSSETYFVITLPSVSAKELLNDAPLIRKAFQNTDSFTKISIREAHGVEDEDSERLVRYLEKKCGTKRAVGLDFNELMEEKESGRSLAILKNFRGEKIENIDKYLYTNVLAGTTKKSKYTIILITPHPEPIKKSHASHKNSFISPNTELKRRLIARAHNISAHADIRPLFEKYQFFSQGIFAGLLTTLILLGILSVGIRAISSLEVSYGAFEKELGPGTLKKE